MLLCPQRPGPLLLAALLVSAACEHGAPAPTQAPSPPPDIASYVTGAAAAALGRDGLFPDPDPAPRERPIISRARARELAMGYVNTFGQFLRSGWEDDHGVPINLPALRAAPRVYYAESPFGTFPEGPFHPAFPRAFGPYYVVTLMDGDVPVLVVGVSAFNTDVGLDDRGQVLPPARGGNEFMSFGVARDPQKYRPLGPEQAVERIGRMAGARAAAPPELMLRARWHPAFALWKVPLDRAVQVRVGKERKPTLAQELYIDGSGAVFVPNAEQPEAEVREVIIGPAWSERKTMPARIPVVPGRATRFEEVVIGSF